MSENLIDRNKWNQIIKSSYDFYNTQIICVPEFKFDNLVFADDLYIEALKKDPNVSKKLKDNKANGLTMFPNDNNNINTPFIFLKTQNGDILNVIISFFHELTHICDFYEFAKFNNTDISKMYKLNSYENYSLWSEFHSFYTETLYAYQFVDFFNCSNDFEILKNIYIENLSEYLHKEFKQAYQSGEIFCYDISRILGRIAFPDIYDNLVGTNCSYIYQYLAEFFSPKQFDDIANLYHFYVETLKNGDILNQLNHLDALLSVLL